MIQDKYPNVPIIPTFGNNDFSLDYNVPWDSQNKTNIFGHLLKTWFNDVPANMALIEKYGNSKTDLDNTFNNGGYYILNIDEKTSIVAINSIYMSSDVSATDQTSTSGPTQQHISWIKTILKANDEKPAAH